MTIEEMFAQLFEKYGEDFNWMIIPKSNKTFNDELKREIGNKFNFDNICSIAKCESNDDVLYLIGDTYIIYHLTWSINNAENFPKYLEFKKLEELKEYIEKDFIENYL